MRSILAIAVCFSALALVQNGLEVTPDSAASAGPAEASADAGSARIAATTGPYRTSGTPAGSIALLGLGLAGLTAAGARKPREVDRRMDLTERWFGE